VKGGSLEIIGIKEQEKENFRKRISCAVLYIGNWLLQNYEVYLVSFNDSIRVANIGRINFILQIVQMFRRDLQVVTLLSFSHLQHPILQFANSWFPMDLMSTPQFRLASSPSPSSLKGHMGLHL
jgi:hypothetical protein